MVIPLKIVPLLNRYALTKHERTDSLEDLQTLIDISIGVVEGRSCSRYQLRPKISGDRKAFIDISMRNVAHLIVHNHMARISLVALLVEFVNQRVRWSLNGLQKVSGLINDIQQRSFKLSFKEELTSL